MQEIWRKIEGFQHYEISNLGRLRSLDHVENNRKIKGRIRATSLSPSGYAMLIVTEKGKQRKGFTIHRLVAKAFISNPNNLPTVNHISGIKTDNRAENLEWCTHKANVTHSYKLGLSKIRHGTQVGTSKLSNQDVIAIKKGLLNKELGISLARKFGVCKQTITLIKQGRRWAHITLK